MISCVAVTSPSEQLTLTQSSIPTQPQPPSQVPNPNSRLHPPQPLKYAPSFTPTAHPSTSNVPSPPKTSLSISPNCLKNPLFGATTARTPTSSSKLSLSVIPLLLIKYPATTAGDLEIAAEQWRSTLPLDTAAASMNSQALSMVALMGEEGVSVRGRRR